MPETTIATFAAAREAFILGRQAAGLSRSTVYHYRMALERFWGDDWPITSWHAEQWLIRARTHGLQPSSVRLYWSRIRTFCRWAVRAGLLAGDPTSDIRVRVPVRLPQVPTPTDVQQVLRACAGDVFDRAVVLVLIDTGLRLAELCRLRWEDVSLVEPRRITIRSGKGSRDRLVPFGPTTAQALNRLMAHQVLVHPEDDVFRDPKGRRYHPNRIDRLLRRLSRRAGLHRPVSAHKYRHYCATELLRHGADLESVRQILGHASLTMTQRYLRLLGADVARAHRRASPADWLER